MGEGDIAGLRLLGNLLAIPANVNDQAAQAARVRSLLSAESSQPGMQMTPQEIDAIAPQASRFPGSDTPVLGQLLGGVGTLGQVLQTVSGAPPAPRSAGALAAVSKFLDTRHKYSVSAAQQELQRRIEGGDTSARVYGAAAGAGSPSVATSGAENMGDAYAARRIFESKGLRGPELDAAVLNYTQKRQTDLAGGKAGASTAARINEELSPQGENLRNVTTNLSTEVKQHLLSQGIQVRDATPEQIDAAQKAVIAQRPAGAGPAPSAERDLDAVAKSKYPDDPVAQAEWKQNERERQKVSLVQQRSNIMASAREFATTSSTRTMIETAPKVKALTDVIDQDLLDIETGPFASRANELVSGKLGEDNPQYLKLKSDGALLSSLIVKMHYGARGGTQLVEDFKNLLGTGFQSTENMRAVLSSFRGYADLVSHRPAGAPSAPSAPPAAPTTTAPTGGSRILSIEPLGEVP